MYDEMEKFFDEKYSKEVLERLSMSVIAHVWNSKTVKYKLNRDSQAPYVQLARQFCPKTLASSYEF